MSEEISAYMVAPTTHGRPALPKRAGPKGLLPSTWLNKGLRVEYVEASGLAVEASGILLDTDPVKPVLSLGGAKTLLCWDSLRLLELVEDQGEGGGGYDDVFRNNKGRSAVQG